MTALSNNRRAGVFAGLSRWWCNLRAARKSLDELTRSGSEAGNIAHDVGLSTADLYIIAAKRPDSADPLERRLEVLHLDRDALFRSDPQVARDLERTCTLCGQKRQCERDLAHSPADPVWQSYCPNADTLQALQEDQRRRGH